MIALTESSQKKNATMKRLNFIIAISLVVSSFGVAAPAPASATEAKSNASSLQLVSTTARPEIGTSRISAKKRLSLKQAKRKYRYITCRVYGQTRYPFDDAGNFNADILHAESQKIIDRNSWAAVEMAKYKWPKSVKRTWVNTEIEWYQYAAQSEASYLSIYDEASWSAQSDIEGSTPEFKAIWKRANKASTKIMKKLGRPSCIVGD